jgi:AcrR family transcriptional regulator
MEDVVTERINRRDLIVETAARLFLEEGYLATSIRQIAGAVGCTEAAIYYHFKGGKRELLRAVVEFNQPQLDALEGLEGARNLRELIQQVGKRLVALDPRGANRFRWIIAEFPKFTEEEREMVLGVMRALHENLAVPVRRFVNDDGDASDLAWMLLTIIFGYGQLFINLELAQTTGFTQEVLLRTVIRSLGDKIQPEGDRTE